MNHPLLLLILTGAGLYITKLWREDRRAAEQGRAPSGALPGATRTTRQASLIAIAGALILLAAETLGEMALGVAAQQSRMTWLFALYSICAAPVIEELVFRGWLVVAHRGRAALWAAAAGMSIVFAVLHPFLWRWEAAGFELTLNLKGGFSTLAVFVTSLWFYAARFAPWNPSRSLLPCFAAHAARNLGVVALKAATGFMDGAW